MIHPRIVQFIRRHIPYRLASRVPRRWRITLNTALADFRQHDPILVYQMGKVGSTAIEKTLLESQIQNPVFHVHYLVDENIRFRKQRRRQKGVLDELSSQHLAVGQGLSWRKRLDGKVNWLLIVGVRDPIERAISQIFQGAIWRYPEVYSGTEISIEKVSELLRTLIKPGGDPIQDTYTWLDSELKSAFGIDVFEHPFDIEKGYQIIEANGARLLLYRVEDMSNVFSEGLPSFLSMDTPLVPRAANEAKTKSYKDVYKKVLSSFKLDRDTCVSLYDHRYMEHFYGDVEKQRLIDRWSLPSQPSPETSE